MTKSNQKPRSHSKAKARTKARSPNTALISALTEPEPIKYDRELMQVLAENTNRWWAEFNANRLAIYRDLMHWYGQALAEAIDERDANKEKQVHRRANREWEALTGLPALTSEANLEILKATAIAAGFPSTTAGLRAWALEKSKQGDIWIGPDSPSQFAKTFDISLSTFGRRRDAGEIRVKEITSKRVLVHRDDYNRWRKK